MKYIKITFMLYVEVMAIFESISLFIYDADFSKVGRSKNKTQNKYQQKIKITIYNI
jgi:hypothetical protein